MTPNPTLSEQRTLADYVTILRRRVWVMVPVIVLAGSLGYLYSTTQGKVYRANAEILLSRQTASAIVTGVQNQDALSDPVRFAQTQAELARSPNVARQAIAKAGVAGRTTAELLDHSRVTPSVNADLLQFTVDNSNPAVAARLAQAYAEAFATYRINLNTAQLAAAYKELRGRIAELRKAGQDSTALYRQLLGSAQQLRTLQLLQTPDVVVKPALRANQIAPRPLRAGLLGAGLGLLLGLALAFLSEALDTKIRSESEIESELELPVLARVPPPTPGIRSGLLMMSEAENPHVDAVRRLRANLEFADLDHKARMIMVTSGVQQEGKSTTASDLAVAFAHAGRDVVLVDLDLRRPSIPGLFALDAGPGLTDVVAGRTTFEKAMVSVDLSASNPVESARESDSAGSFRILPAGTLPASPGQFIGTEALADSLARLRAGHELVILDTPPLLPVGDPGMLSAHVDAIVVIARFDRMTRSVLGRLKNELANTHALKLGVVITGVDAEPAYGYDYHSTARKQRRRRWRAVFARNKQSRRGFTTTRSTAPRVAGSNGTSAAGRDALRGTITPEIDSQHPVEVQSGKTGSVSRGSARRARQTGR